MFVEEGTTCTRSTAYMYNCTIDICTVQATQQDRQPHTVVGQCILTAKFPLKTKEAQGHFPEPPNTQCPRVCGPLFDPTSENDQSHPQHDRRK